MSNAKPATAFQHELRHFGNSDGLGRVEGEGEGLKNYSYPGLNEGGCMYVSCKYHDVDAHGTAPCAGYVVRTELYREESRHAKL